MPENIVNATVASIRRTFPAHVPLYLSSILSNAIIVAVLSEYGIVPRFEAAKTFLFLFAVVLAGLAAFYIIAETVAVIFDGFPPDPLTRCAKRLMHRLLAEDRIANSLHAIAALGPLLVGFMVFKSAITLIHPFDWDPALSSFDNMIGFGHQPWKLIEDLIGYPSITIFLAWSYYIWFLALLGGLAQQGFSRRCSPLRMQFLLAMAFAFFVGGCVLAAIFSSAGPCYFGNLHLGYDPYVAQMNYLRGIGPNTLPSVVVQDALWKAFTGGRLEEGVSAMPSMHVTIAVLIGFLGWRKGGLSAFAFPAFAILIAIASVHLAWHYAGDALAGIVLGALFWYAAGIIVRYWYSYLALRIAANVDSPQKELPDGAIAPRPLQ